MTGLIHWIENEQAFSARWQSESATPAPRRVMVADDRMTADDAWRLACSGTALLWRGDFQNARQLLQAMGRRIERKGRKKGSTPLEAFNLHRLAQSQRARTLGMLLIPFQPGHLIPLRRAPDVVQACTQAYGPNNDTYVCSLRELLGLIGAYEWRKNGVEISALQARIHPHYGVFSPLRGEYLDLIENAPLPATDLAYDIGTGTGVIAALLAKRGIKHIIGTDTNPRALACAEDNLQKLGYADSIKLENTDLFPAGQAGLIVCNPPWLPARPSSPIENAVYDPDSQMLMGFLNGLAAHLAPSGEGWLILSDLAEHLGLRSREALLKAIDAAGLTVLQRLDIRPRHPKTNDADDPLYEARKQEVTSLWRLGARPT
ncbi:methyltransferase [Uliginosibacterium gangwonense]|uniref:methyltransferase n=1 Tax=Uliginosibacterium gangwonense TaxID=392736 RepID=UPI0003825755|nr:class I SAM-dependent methyltransferase [Uliginosibacterium gangwonense]